MSSSPAPSGRQPSPDPQFGVVPLVIGTLLTTLIACARGPAPWARLGHLPVRVRHRPAAPQFSSRMLEVLAGIPTVIYGFFALTFVTPFLRAIFPGGGDVPTIFNTLSAGLVMGVMIIPTVASLSEDAMAAVPNGLRQGAFALGSNKRQVSTRVVVPAALSGISAAFILGISRAIGETMIVAMAGGRPAQH